VFAIDPTALKSSGIATESPVPIQNQPKIAPVVEFINKPVVIPIEAINPPLAKTLAAPNFVAKKSPENLPMIIVAEKTIYGIALTKGDAP
jgi:hypothetical protein